MFSTHSCLTARRSAVGFLRVLQFPPNIIKENSFDKVVVLLVAVMYYTGQGLVFFVK